MAVAVNPFEVAFAYQCRGCGQWFHQRDMASYEPYGAEGFCNTCDDGAEDVVECDHCGEDVPLAYAEITTEGFTCLDCIDVTIDVSHYGQFESRYGYDWA